jgi:hypothetical protein
MAFTFRVFTRSIWARVAAHHVASRDLLAPNPCHEFRALRYSSSSPARLTGRFERSAVRGAAIPPDADNTVCTVAPRRPLLRSTKGGRFHWTITPPSGAGTCRRSLTDGSRAHLFSRAPGARSRRRRARGRWSTRIARRLESAFRTAAKTPVRVVASAASTYASGPSVRATARATSSPPARRRAWARARGKQDPLARETS